MTAPINHTSAEMAADLRKLIGAFADDDRMTATQEAFAEQARETLHYAAARLDDMDALCNQLLERLWSVTPSRIRMPESGPDQGAG